MQDSYHKIERIHWIDFTRGLCMIVVVFYHTESYYIDVYHVLKYDWLSNFLKAFFFLSGYLLFKREEKHDSTFLKYKLNRIIRSLIIPYFAFTLILAVPKCYAHGLDIGETLKIAEQLGIRKVTLGVMLGKAVKLAAGNLDTHSRKTTMNMDFIQQMLNESGITVDISDITLARELWEIIPSSQVEDFASVVIFHCYNHCKPLLPSGELTILLIDENGKIYAL
jgi:hypothetical protein